jgi:hypothetical protein
MTLDELAGKGCIFCVLGVVVLLILGGIFSSDSKSPPAAPASQQAGEPPGQDVSASKPETQPDAKLWTVSDDELVLDSSYATALHHYGCTSEEWLADFRRAVDAHDDATMTGYAESGKCINVDGGIPVTVLESGLFTAEFLYRGVKIWADSGAIVQRSQHERVVRAEDFGAKWPYLVSAGVLECRPGKNNAVLFRAHGEWYRLNGSAEGLGPPDDAILRQGYYGAGDILTVGLELCK